MSSFALAIVADRLAQLSWKEDEQLGGQQVRGKYDSLMEERHKVRDIAMQQLE